MKKIVNFRPLLLIFLTIVATIYSTLKLIVGNYIPMIVFAIFTYTDFLSLMSVFATMLYTYSVWQKSTKVYKRLGAPISLIWIIYNIYIKSLFGIILEIILMSAAIIGLIREEKSTK